MKILILSIILTLGVSKPCEAYTTIADLYSAWDDMTNIYVYSVKSAKRTVYPYILSTPDTHTFELFIFIKDKDVVRIQPNKIYVRADDQRVILFPETSEHVNTLKIRVTHDNFETLAGLTTAKVAKLRFRGTKYYKDISLSPSEQDALLKVFEAYFQHFCDTGSPQDYGYECQYVDINPNLYFYDILDSLYPDLTY